MAIQEPGLTVGEVLGSESRRVYTVLPGDTIADTVDMLGEYQIGAVVVTSDGKTIDGIISERDVVRHLAREQEGTLRLWVEDLMTSNVKVCRMDDSIESAMATMVDGKFRHMPIVDEAGAMCGLVSLGDLVSARLAQLEQLTIELRQAIDV